MATFDSSQSAPIKTYNLINNSTFSRRHCVLQQNGQNILWVNLQVGCFKKPQVNIQIDSETGPIVAASRPTSWGAGVRVTLGEPEGKSKEEWADVDASSWTAKEYNLYFGDRKYQWRRTHNKALGASSWGSMDFKLVDNSDNDRVLAVYINDRKLFSASQVGRLEYYVELGRELELFSLAAILGIEDRIRRRRNSGAAAGGAAGGAGA